MDEKPETKPLVRREDARTEALDRALASVKDLVVTVLESDDPGRFADAAQLCSLGQGMRRALADRADDFEDGAYDPNFGLVMPNPVANFVGRNGRRARQILGGHDNQAERDLAHMLPDLISSQQKVAEVGAVRDEARERNELVGTLKSLDGREDEVSSRLRDATMKRLDALTKKLEEKNKEEPHADPALVHPDVAR